MNITSAVAAAILFGSPAVVLAQVAKTPRIFDSMGGWGSCREYSNHLPTDNALGNEKIRKLRDLKRDISFEEFLGSKIRAIRVEFIDEKHFDKAKAHAIIKEILSTPVIRAKGISQEPNLFCPWAEGSQTFVRAIVDYENGFIGRIETDGLHHMIQDDAGFYWWYRDCPGKKCGK